MNIGEFKQLITKLSISDDFTIDITWDSGYVGTELLPEMIIVRWKTLIIHADGCQEKGELPFNEEDTFL